MGISCFMIEHAGKTQRSLRRYVSSADMTEGKCSVSMHGYHQTMVDLDVVPEIWGVLPGHDFECWHNTAPEVPHTDDRWNNVCACGYVFTEQDQWQIFTDSIYRRTDNGLEYTLRSAPAGAMWWATWMPKNMYWDDKTDDHLVVRLPDGTDWDIDSRCNNCPWPGNRQHRCWGRSG